MVTFISPSRVTELVANAESMRQRIRQCGEVAIVEIEQEIETACQTIRLECLAQCGECCMVWEFEEVKTFAAMAYGRLHRAEQDVFYTVHIPRNGDVVDTRAAIAARNRAARTAERIERRKARQIYLGKIS